ncbi:MAG: hypothetical protein Q9163_004091 [Psora crenata]
MAFDGPRALLFVILFIYIFLSPDRRTASSSRRRDFEQQVLVERAALSVLNASNYNSLDAAGNRWLDIPGFRKVDGYAWNILPKVQERAKEQFDAILFAAPTVSKVINTSKGATGKGQQEDERAVSQDALSSMTPFTEPLPMYTNVTGILRGTWARSKVAEWIVPMTPNLTALAPNVTYASQSYDRNVTGRSGDLRVKLAEQSIDHDLGLDARIIRKIKAEMVIKDEISNGDGWDITMFGVHYPQQGGVILSTTSEKFMGVFALPHFTLSARAFELSRRLLSSALKDIIGRQESSFDAALNPWTSSPNNPADSLSPIPHCEFIVYLQQHPHNDPDIIFQDVEDELRYPTGAPIPSVPDLKMSALIFSPDCGFVLESKGPPDYSPAEGLHLVGRKIEAYIRTARNFILFFALLVCAELLLLKRQMNEALTPSTKSRISFYSIAMMALGDGFACTSLLVAAMLIDALFVPLVATAFLSFLCVSFFGMKFLMDIWAVQAPERQERERERQRLRDHRNATAAENRPRPVGLAPTPAPPAPHDPVLSAAGADTLPLPATARRGPDNATATPVILPPDQDLTAAEAEDAAVTNAGTATDNQATTTTLGNARREMGALYSKFYFLLLTILFLSLHATSWQTTARSVYCNLISFIYLSFWTPQIYRNVMRNCRKALSWYFVIGESLLRLAPFLYFYVSEDNVLYVKTNPLAILLLSGWVWIQVFVLASQEAVGPRFFVPEGWAPPAYDYHPILREARDGETGSNMPVGFTEAITSPTLPVAATSTGDTSPTATRASQQSKDKNKRTFDCAICTETFDVPVVSPPESEGEAKGTAVAATTIFARRAYMVTPCRHIFHSGCLEGWMRYRLQCPICREGLPPL